VAAAVCGSVVTIALRGTPSPATPKPPPVGTASVVRTDLSSSVLTEGMLGYAPSPPVVNRLAGTYTSLLSPGTVVASGQVLYRVDNTPVVLCAGTVPAWRPFTPGMPDGPDVAELEACLIALGDAHGLLTAATPQFGPGAVAAVRRWQTSVGELSTGAVDLGDIVFAPAPLRVGALDAALGQPAAPGDMPYQVTTTWRTVAVPLTPDDPAVTVGQAVSIVLSSGATTPGHVAALGPPPPSGGSGSGSSGSSSGSSGGSGSSSGSGGTSSAPSTVATVLPDDPGATGSADGQAVQVSLTVQSARHVLAVPVAALLALAGGGYGVEVVHPSGRHQLVGVQTGVFAGGEVEVTGTALAPGVRVAVAQ
jgi:uncharacterized membrane protein YgcG